MLPQEFLCVLNQFKEEEEEEGEENRKINKVFAFEGDDETDTKWGRRGCDISILECCLAT